METRWLKQIRGIKGGTVVYVVILVVRDVTPGTNYYTPARGTPVNYSRRSTGRRLPVPCSDAESEVPPG